MNITIVIITVLFHLVSKFEMLDLHMSPALAHVAILNLTTGTTVSVCLSSFNAYNLN